MRRAARFVIVAALALIMVAPAFAQGTRTQVKPYTGELFTPAVSNLFGATTNVTPPNDTNWCFNATSADSTFSTGETAAFNIVWEDSASGSTVYNVSWALQLPNGDLFPLFIDGACNFGTLDPGDYTFCCALFADAPAQSFDGPWGGRVVAVSGGSGSAQGLLNTVDVN